MENVDRNIKYTTRRGQEVCLVLHALLELGGENRKRDVIDYIVQNRHISVSPGDFVPYENTNEPKYHTLLAWARKDGVIKDWITNDEKDAWCVNRYGRGVLESCIKRFRNGTWDLVRCWLFSVQFKKTLDPNYKPLEKEPKSESEVLLHFLFKDIDI